MQKKLVRSMEISTILVLLTVNCAADDNNRSVGIHFSGLSTLQELNSAERSRIDGNASGFRLSFTKYFARRFAAEASFTNYGEVSDEDDRCIYDPISHVYNCGQNEIVVETTAVAGGVRYSGGNPSHVGLYWHGGLTLVKVDDSLVGNESGLGYYFGIGLHGPLTDGLGWQIAIENSVAVVNEELVGLTGLELGLGYSF